MNAIEILSQILAAATPRPQTRDQTRQRPGSGQRLQRHLRRSFHRGRTSASPARKCLARRHRAFRTGARRNARGRESQETVCAIDPGTGTCAVAAHELEFSHARSRPGASSTNGSTRHRPGPTEPGGCHPDPRHDSGRKGRRPAHPRGTKRHPGANRRRHARCAALP